jgi:uncharacterized protein (DUF2336 family)
VLERSVALGDADLMSIVQSSENVSKMNSIARRSSVSAEVSRSLVRHGDETTAQTLLGNATANIPEDAYGSVLDRFGASEKIQEAIISREEVAPAITQRLAESVTSAQLMDKLAARERSALPGFAVKRSEEEWSQRIAQLIAEKAKEALLVNTLCNGDFDFFSRALAAMNRVPHDEMKRGLIETPSVRLLTAWTQASLAADWQPVASAALSALLHMDRTASKLDRQLFVRNVMDRTQATLRTEKISLSDAQRRIFARYGSR